MSKELKALFEGIQVAEGFEKKVETIFEVAVAEAAEERIAKQAKTIEESFEKRLTEAKEEFVKMQTKRLKRRSMKPSLNGPKQMQLALMVM